ncbi:hypothetical protein AB0J14_38325 [Micromonospora arborensis]|uniref:hypothetical protein n=1 Tax=Micromonospora arborensis TaxID=2116518 RepID=UPI0033F70001
MFSSVVELRAQLDEWAGRHKFQVVTGDWKMPRYAKGQAWDRVMKVFFEGSDEWALEVCDDSGTVMYWHEGTLEFITKQVELVSFAVGKRYHLSRRGSRRKVVEELTELPGRFLQALRLDLEMRQQPAELLVEAMADKLLPQCKSLTCEEALHLFDRARNWDEADEILARVHGPALEEMRRRYRVPPGAPKQVRRKIARNIMRGN